MDSFIRRLIRDIELVMYRYRNSHGISSLKGSVGTQKMSGVKGVILAGGSATRMGDLAVAGGKHILPIGGLPMIIHPLKKMIASGVTDILVVTSPEQVGGLTRLLGSGDRYCCSVNFRIQDRPGGIAQALLLASGFVGDSRVVVILGDNIWQDPIPDLLISESDSRAWVCLSKVSDSERYGIAILDEINKSIVKIIEKPTTPESDLAVCGIYSYPPDVFNVIRKLQPSGRGELEITDVNNYYLDSRRLEYVKLPGWWIDAGEPAALEEANHLILEKPINW